MKKIKKQQVFYSVKGATVEGGAMIARGIFDVMGAALKEGEQFKEWEVWRHKDEHGERVEDKIINSSYPF